MVTLQRLYVQLQTLSSDGKNVENVQRQVQTFVRNVTTTLKTCQAVVSERAIRLEIIRTKTGAKLVRIERLINRLNKDIGSHRDMLLDDYQELSEVFLKITERTTVMNTTVSNMFNKFLPYNHNRHVSDTVTSTLSRYIQRANNYINRMNTMSINFKAEILMYPHKDSASSVMMVDDLKEIDNQLEVHENKPGRPLQLSSINSPSASRMTTPTVTTNDFVDSDLSAGPSHNRPQSSKSNAVRTCKNHADQLSNMLREIARDNRLKNGTKRMIKYHLKIVQYLLKNNPDYSDNED